MALNATVLPAGQYGWIHDLRAILDGTPQAAVTLAQAAGLTGMLVKYNDGSSTTAGEGSGEAWQWQFRQLAPACAAAGLACIPWGYVYPTDRAPFAQLVAAALQDSNQPFYILDAEIDFDNDSSAAADAQALLSAIHQGAPNVRLLYTSWGWPDQHPNFPWAVMNAGTQAFLPQIYPALIGTDPTSAYNRAFLGGNGGGQGIYQMQPQPAAVIPTFDLSAIATLASLARTGGFTAVTWWVMDGMTSAQATQLNSTPYAHAAGVDWRTATLNAYGVLAAIRKAGGW
ncbi:MAG TPA: hypothetical protein VNM16_03850 [Bacillota bacterium]|nr:hypothetical protein [Bacillota bacterium]